MIREHDSTSPDTNRLGSRSDVSNDDGCGCAGDADHVVMLGQPVTVVVPTFGMLGEIQRIPESLRGSRASGHESEIQNGKTRHEPKSFGSEPLSTIRLTDHSFGRD